MEHMAGTSRGAGGASAARILAGALVVAPIAAFGAVWSGGAGHGDYLLAKVFFPYTMLSTAATEVVTALGFAAGLAQYSIYGLCLAWVAQRHPARLRLVAGVLLAAHVVAVAACFVVPIQNFS